MPTMPASIASPIRLARRPFSVKAKAARPKGQPVGLRDRLIEGLEWCGHDDRAERLLVHDPRLDRHLAQHGRAPEEAVAIDRLAAGAQQRALGDRVSDELLHRGGATGIGHRAHVACCVEPVADLNAAEPRGERLDEAIVNAFLHIEARRRNADLPGIACFADRERLDRLFQIAIVEDDHGRVPAQLHRRPLHRL
jgi:hypothetical protein